jgi:23S rRNA (uracil1939-C5)-methyltransferase
VAHPLAEEVLVAGRFPGAAEVTVRVGAATGERLVLVHGPGSRAAAAAASVPGDVRIVADEDLAAGRRAWIHDEVAGRRWRISAGSFFQTRPDGAEALVDAVVAAAGGPPAPGTRIVDAYAGVGLLAGALTRGWPPEALGRVQAVERSASSVADARHNLGREGGGGGSAGVRVVHSDVDRWRSRPADLVVADPARGGLGRRGVAALVAAQAPVLVLVSCDPGSLGRDARLLGEEGYRAAHTTLVDMFPHTHHVEAVTGFHR